MNYIPIEKLWERFSNKYEAIVVAASEVRRMIEAIRSGEIKLNENLYIYTIKRVIDKKRREGEASKL